MLFGYHCCPKVRPEERFSKLKTITIKIVSSIWSKTSDHHLSANLILFYSKLLQASFLQSRGSRYLSSCWKNPYEHKYATVNLKSNVIILKKLPIIQFTLLFEINLQLQLDPTRLKIRHNAKMLCSLSLTQAN